MLCSKIDVLILRSVQNTYIHYVIRTYSSLVLSMVVHKVTTVL